MLSELEAQLLSPVEIEGTSTKLLQHCVLPGWSHKTSAPLVQLLLRGAARPSAGEL